MAVREVTQAEYEAVTGSNPSSFRGSRNPVETVSYEEATRFCTKLAERERQAGRLPRGYEYRLPTDAEWEYCCRAGTQTEYSFGSDGSDLGTYGWYGANAGQQPHEVGGLRPNAWGLYDMHGNVWEWCLDWYGDFSTRPETDPGGPRQGRQRVLRGGSWVNYYVSQCRSAIREFYAPDRRTSGAVGFRVVCAPEL